VLLLLLLLVPCPDVAAADDDEHVGLLCGAELGCVGASARVCMAICRSGTEVASALGT